MKLLRDCRILKDAPSWAIVLQERDVYDFQCLECEWFFSNSSLYSGRVYHHEYCSLHDPDGVRE